MGGQRKVTRRMNSVCNLEVTEQENPKERSSKEETEWQRWKMEVSLPKSVHVTEGTAGCQR